MRARRLALAVAALVGLVVSLIGPVAPAEAGISAFSGHCEIRMKATFTGDGIDFVTPDPAPCFTDAGTIARMEIAGSVGPGDTFPGFDCLSGAGRGTFSVTVADHLRSFSAENLDMTMVFAAGAATVNLTNWTGNHHFVASGSFVQPVTVIGPCLANQMTVTWLGVIDFSAPEVSGQVSAYSGVCQVRLDVERSGSNVAFTTGEDPGLCLTDGTALAELDLTGSAGPGETFPGFDCANGAGRGTASMSISDRWASFSGDNLNVLMVEAGGVVGVDFTTVVAGTTLIASGVFVQPSTVVQTCVAGATTTSWLGTIVYSNPKVRA